MCWLQNLVHAVRILRSKPRVSRDQTVLAGSNELRLLEIFVIGRWNYASGSQRLTCKVKDYFFKMYSL